MELRKAGARVLYLIMGLGAVAGLCLLAYKYIPVFKSGVDSIAGSASHSTGSDSQTVTSSNASGTVKLGTTIESPMFAATVGETLTAVATLSPDNVTDKLIVWSLSDATNVQLSTATTMSGEAQTLTLKSLFDGSINLIATSHADPTVKTSCRVYIENKVWRTNHVSLEMSADGNNTDGFEYDWEAYSSGATSTADTQSISGNGTSGYTTFTATSNSTSCDFGTKFDCTLKDSSSVFTMDSYIIGLDTSRLPHIASYVGVTASDTTWTDISLSSSPYYVSGETGFYVLSGMMAQQYNTTLASSSAFLWKNITYKAKGITDGSGRKNLVIRATVTGPLTEGDEVDLRLWSLDVAGSHSVSKEVIQLNIHKYVAPSGITGLSDKGF